MQRELSTLERIALADLRHRGELGPVALLDTTLNAIDALNPAPNAVIQGLDDEVRRVATVRHDELPQGRGQPVASCSTRSLCKDLLAECKGAPFREGCRALKNFVAQNDSELVVYGRANSPEFGRAPVTEPELGGVTRDPWHSAQTPGRSSAGSAAMVATAAAPMAPTNDGCGCIRSYAYNLAGQPARSVPAQASAAGLAPGLRCVGHFRDKASFPPCAAACTSVPPTTMRPSSSLQ